MNVEVMHAHTEVQNVRNYKRFHFWCNTLGPVCKILRLSWAKCKFKLQQGTSRVSRMASYVNSQTLQNQGHSRALYSRTFVQHWAAQHRTHIFLLNLHFKAWARDRRDFERRQLRGFEQDICHCFVVHRKSSWRIVSAWGGWGARKKIGCDMSWLMHSERAFTWT